MFKKLTLTLMALSALVAIALPSVASANTGELTLGGKRLAVGAPLSATSSWIQTIAPHGVWACEMTLGGTVIKNSSTGSSVNVDAAHSTSKKCRLNSNFEGSETTFTVTEIAGSIRFEEPTTSMTLSSVWNGFAFGQFNNCHVSGTLPISYTAGSSSFSTAGATTYQNCWEPVTNLQGEFALSSNGKAVVLH